MNKISSDLGSGYTPSFTRLCPATKKMKIALRSNATVKALPLLVRQSVNVFHVLILVDEYPEVVTVPAAPSYYRRSVDEPIF